MNDPKIKILQKINDLLDTDRDEDKKEAPQTLTININGGNGDGNGIGNTIIKTEQVIHRRKVEVKTGDGVITAEQKSRLQALVKEWIELHNAVKSTKKSFAAAWSAVNKQAKVNSYHEIPAEKYETVEKWLIRQISILNASPSAKTKSTKWRSDRITAIQSRSNELGIQDKRKAYMMTTFGKDSLTMLSDADVEKVYRWVMSKR